MAEKPEGPDYAAIAATLLGIGTTLAGLRDLIGRACSGDQIKLIPKIQETVSSLDELQIQLRHQMELLEHRVEAAERLHDTRILELKADIKRLEDEQQALRDEVRAIQEKRVLSRSPLRELE